MKNKKSCIKYIVLIFLSLACLNGYLIYRITEVKKYSFEILEDRQKLKNEIQFFKSKELTEFVNSNQEIDTNIFLDKVLWNNFISNKKKVLVLVYSKLHCNVCVERLVELIKENWENDNHEKLILFVDYDQEKYLDIFKRVNKIDYQMFKIDMAEMNEFITIKDHPFFMVINNGIEIEKIFIPDKNDFRNTNTFLKLTNKYFSK